MKPNLQNIFQVIQIVAIAYLVYSILHLADGNKKLDQIAKDQAEIKADVAKTILDNQKAEIKYDSVDRLHIQKIDSININIMKSNQKLQSLNTKISVVRNIFEDNKVVLPNPDAK